MKRGYAATVLFALVAMSAGPAEAAAQADPGAHDRDQIVVVNRSVQPVRVYVEGADGRRSLLGRLERGRAATYEAPADVVEGGDFRVVVRPAGYDQSTREQVSIKTHPLHVEGDETVVLWLERELSRSQVGLLVG